MKILLVYPPDRTLPTIPFSSLAVLQGCLRGRGHTTVVRDMNVEVFHHLVTREKLTFYADLVQRWFKELDGKPELTAAEYDRYRFVAPIAAVPRDVLLRAEDSLRVMKDPARFFDAATFNQAFDDLAAMIRFLYAASPMYDVEAEDFVTRNVEALMSFGGDPVHEAYGALLDSVVAEKPDAVCITMPFSFQFFEGLRFAKRFRERLPQVPVIVVTGAFVNADQAQMVGEGVTACVLKDNLSTLAPAVRHALIAAAGSALCPPLQDILASVAQLRAQSGAVARPALETIQRSALQLQELIKRFAPRPGAGHE